MRLVLLGQFLRDEPFGRSPDEVHFGVRGAERQARLENQKHAAIEKKERADQTRRYWNPRAARARKGDHADSHAGRYEDTDREIESRQHALQQTRSAGQLVERVVEHEPLFFGKLCRRTTISKLLKTIRKRAHAVDYPSQPR